MEELGVSGGFVSYRTTLQQDYSSVTLNVTCIRDRGYVLLDGVGIPYFFFALILYCDMFVIILQLHAPYANKHI